MRRRELDELFARDLQRRRPLTPSPEASEVVRALIDLSTWRAFTDRGFTTDQATETVSRLAECSLRPPSSGV